MFYHAAKKNLGKWCTPLIASSYRGNEALSLSYTLNSKAALSSKFTLHLISVNPCISVYLIVFNVNSSNVSAHPNASVQTANGSPGRSVGNMRMRSKNYASPDCGAKIVAANPEARSARSVLVSTRDEYMLNTCTSRVWFVVELCEAIQAKKIELGMDFLV